MKNFLILFLAIMLFASCGRKNGNDLLFTCYAYNDMDIYNNIYIEIHRNGFIEATAGLRNDTVDLILYKGGELHPDKDLFMLSKENPDSTFDEFSQSWDYYTYKRLTTKTDSLSHEQMHRLKSMIKCFRKSRSKNVDKDFYENGLKLEFSSLGVVFMTEGDSFKFWEKTGTKEQRELFNLINELSPIHIDPNIVPRDCMSGSNDKEIVVEIKE